MRPLPEAEPARTPAAGTSVSASSRERVLGWDLLRGLCALTVMSYHLLGWQDIAHLSPLGTYGVYLFFLLSVSIPRPLFPIGGYPIIYHHIRSLSEV